MTPAERYAAWRILPSHLAEQTLLAPPAKMPELEVQARWFAGQFSRRMTDTEGQPVEIIHYGVWNREPGPDFSGAVVRLGDQPPRAGAIEIDLDRRDWERHGHATNPVYENVVLHVFVEPGASEFFSRTASHRLVPQARLSLAGLDEPPPFPPLAILGRCSAPLAVMDSEKVTSLLEAAAHFRLREKSRELKQVIALHGEAEALFQRLARALGYKENKLPFELLAQRLPLADLRKDALRAEAMLFGAAGFLDAPDLAAFAGDTRNYLRQLWDQWWSCRAEMQHLILPRTLWKFTGTRPANHPQRRLGALASLVAHWRETRTALTSGSLEKLAAGLEKLSHPFWKNHYTLSSQATATAMPLIGQSRIVDIFVNLTIPHGLADEPELWRTLATTRQPLNNRSLETAALRLFGDNVSPRKLLVFALYQQGLLQIYQDFCLRDLTDCARCPFPEKVRSWTVG